MEVEIFVSRSWQQPPLRYRNVRFRVMSGYEMASRGGAKRTRFAGECQLLRKLRKSAFHKSNDARALLDQPLGAPVSADSIRARSRLTSPIEARSSIRLRARCRAFISQVDRIFGSSI